MAGYFVNTQKKDYINNLVEGYKDIIKNPYYIHSSMKPTLVTYYSINREKSTLDEGLKQVYAPYGDNCPLRYNKISDFYVYGIEKIAISLENGDFGIEDSGQEGELIVLPNTIIPTPGDYFTISYIERTYLFEINNVTADTIESGANFYKCNYKFTRDSADCMDNLVVEDYNLIIDNISTEYKSIIRSNEYNFITEINEISDNLKLYYKHLFYNNRVQTFICTIGNEIARCYDPYLVEFLIRNNLMDNSEEFTYITQQVNLPNTFAIDYDKSFFRSVELKNKDNLSEYRYFDLSIIKDPLSILSMRKESYFITNYINTVINDTYNSFDNTLYSNIVNNVKQNTIYDVIVKYFNDEQLDGNDIKIINDISYNNTKNLFYCIPILIYILEHNIKNLLRR